MPFFTSVPRIRRRNRASENSNAGQVVDAQQVLHIPYRAMRSVRGENWRAIASGFGTIFLAGWYGLLVLGIPLPIASHPTNSGERYPCESCACGCDSAEHCWRSCCCHTLVERLAWAAKNGVKPPDFVLVAAREAGLNSAGRPHAKPVRVATMTKSSCGIEHSCCSSHDSKPSCAADAHPQHRSKQRDFVVALRALACHGQSFQWLAAVPTLISVDLRVDVKLPLVAWLGPVLSDVAECVAILPSLPPPERA
jgi:hypothetical protein